MNIRTILICLSALGLASGSRASSISDAVLVNGGLSQPAYTVASTGPRHARIHGSRTTSSRSVRSTSNNGDISSSLPQPSPVELQDWQTPGAPASMQTSRTAPLALMPSGTSGTYDSGMAYSPAFRPLTQTGNDVSQLPSGHSLCGSPCFTEPGGFDTPGAGKYGLIPGAHDLTPSGPSYQLASKPAGSVAMPEPDMSLLLLIDLGFLAGAVTFLRSKYGNKKPCGLGEKGYGPGRAGNGV